MQVDALPLRIGITGNIGSGKSTVCKIFELFGIPVYYADDRAKTLMTNDPTLVNQIKALLGEEAYLSDGGLNRAHIASIVFQDSDKLANLNALVHPAVAKDGQNWHKQHANTPYTLHEAALLYESGNDKNMDAIIVVTAPKALRLERVMKRDQIDAASVEARMNKQMPASEKVERADYLILNDGEHALIPQIWQLHQQLKSRS